MEDIKKNIIQRGRECHSYGKISVAKSISLYAGKEKVIVVAMYAIWERIAMLIWGGRDFLVSIEEERYSQVNYVCLMASCSLHTYSVIIYKW